MNQAKPLMVAVVSHNGGFPVGFSSENARIARSPGQLRSIDDVVLFYGPRMAEACRVFSRRLGAGMPPAMVLAPRFDPADAVAAVEQGVISYLLEGRYDGCLFQALSGTSRGISFLDPLVQSELVRLRRIATVPAYSSREDSLSTSAEKSTEGYGLSPREIEIMNLLSDGLTVLDAAKHLSLSEKTVRNTLCRIYRKLNVRRLPEAILIWVGRLPT
ncbi:helix-turn-helix transcriptional regulator [Streptomyces sp. SD31]|uniref:helix-turn-helix transcriptional regulator n=1 Tax=Streptomyces sp. SD31 TaxID=3452208 RepID=UPI003F88F216